MYISNSSLKGLWILHNEGTVPAAAGQEVVLSFFSPSRSDKTMKNEAH